MEPSGPNSDSRGQRKAISKILSAPSFAEDLSSIAVDIRSRKLARDPIERGSPSRTTPQSHKRELTPAEKSAVGRLISDPQFVSDLAAISFDLRGRRPG